MSFSDRFTNRILSSHSYRRVAQDDIDALLTKTPFELNQRREGSSPRRQISSTETT